MASKLRTLTANAHRITSKIRVTELLGLLWDKNPSVAYIQEIGVKMAAQVFGPHYQIFINMDEETMGVDGIGIATIVKKDIIVKDIFLGEEGRTIGVKTKEGQFWNIYPKSGTENKKWRENYFREELPNMMTAWKDHTRWINLGGDFNCTHRLIDSLNNQGQHLQKGLQKHMKIFGLEDDYVRLNGDQVCYSRITNRSRTRIDMILSNMGSLLSFEYWDPGLPSYDHKFGIAEYEIDVEVIKEDIPKHRKYNGWAFPKELEGDLMFLSKAEDICGVINAEVEKEKEDDLDVDYTEKWVFIKNELIFAAKRRSSELRKLENGRKDMLRMFLNLSMKKIEAGVDDFENFKKIRTELRKIEQKRTERIIEKNKSVEIEDHIYDINKLEKQKKYENSKKIMKLNIRGDTFEGTLNILGGVENKIKAEVEDYELDNMDEPSAEELEFLLEMDHLQLSDMDKKEIVGAVLKDECEEIFKNQVNLDSSPGPDGCTYRLFYFLFKKIGHFREIFIKMIDWTRDHKSLGCLSNSGVMVIINKKKFTENYDGKRKLTKVNKDINFIGKLWSNRFRDVVLPKALPKCQYNCQNDQNIVDENRHIREVVRFLRGDVDGQEKDGTLVAFDFKDAFRSVILRWFRLVLEKLEIPTEFRSWFWALYRDLSISIVINGAKSGEIFIKRGFMEGHPPSMPCFVTAIIPLIIVIKKRLKGIRIHSGALRKMFAFADDLKLVLRDAQEIHQVFKIIKKFQIVSGLEMHMDPSREKCQALCFGSHREYDQWPIWITVKEVVNILGILYGNKKDVSLECLNSDFVKKKVLMKLFGASGIRGTVLQKTQYANTYLLSKVWYVAQIFILNIAMLKEIDRLIRKFIFAGQNERPVQAMCYRPKDMAGLNLICVQNKSRAFIIKNMVKEREELVALDNVEGEVYGNMGDMDKILNSTVSLESLKDIYLFFLQEKIGTWDNPIKSRSERNNLELNWRQSWKNWSRMTGITAVEKQFGWDILQDLIHVPSRNHRRGSSKVCPQLVQDQDSDIFAVCGKFGDLKHSLTECLASRDKFSFLRDILETFLDRKISTEEVIFLSFRHYDEKKIRMGTWFVVKSLGYIFSNRKSEC